MTQTGVTASRPFVPVAEGGGRIDSETGALREVIVHRPGGEIARLTPINADSLLFDDALNIPRAQAEHDAFTAILRSEGVIVHDFRELFTEVLAVPEARRLVLDEAVGPDVVGVSASELLIDYFQSLPEADLAEVLLGGITRTELRERLTEVADWQRPPLAPPTTPINNTPVARAVYFPSPSRDKEKIAPHIREWKSPTPISNQGILRRMASTTKSPAQKVLTASCMWALIIERKLEKKRPTSIENQ